MVMGSWHRELLSSLYVSEHDPSCQVEEVCVNGTVRLEKLVVLL